MPGRPSKPTKVLEIENRSHRTKKELAVRKKGEASTMSGRKLVESSEVKKNLEAHREFLRLSKLLAAVDKNDALYSEVINRYCMLKAECIDFTAKRESLVEEIRRLEDSYGEMEKKKYFSLMSNLQKSAIAYDRQIQQKRKMMFDIEKENIMTIAAALRSVQKQVETKKNKLLEALNG